MKKRESGTGFRNVDETGDAGYFVEYLDSVSALEAVQNYKLQTFSLLRTQNGHRVLDIGCGTEDDVRAIAQTVGVTGSVVGIDFSEEMIGEARKRSEGTGLPLEFLVGDAHNLEFANDSFDSCRSDRTFQHLELPYRALEEMVRVTRSGGRIVVSDPDWETLVIDSPYKDVTRKLVNLYCDTIIRNGWIARQMPAMFKDAGLQEVEVALVGFTFTDFELANQILPLRLLTQRGPEAKAVSKDQANQWLNHLEEAAERDRFFCAVSGVIVACTKLEG